MIAAQLVTIFRDDVEPVAVDRQGRFQHARHQVSQAFGPLGRAQHVVVGVLEVWAHPVVDHVQITVQTAAIMT